MSMQAAKILMAESEARSILLGGFDPLELEWKVLDALTVPNLRLAIEIAARSNREDLGAKMVMAATMEMSRKCGLTPDVAASNVFETSWSFLMKFADMPNRDIPRRFFGGLAWGIIGMNDKIDITLYLSKIILAPRFPPFLYVTGGVPEADIKKIVRDWTSKNRPVAKEILAEVKNVVKNKLWARPEPTPLGRMIAETMVYSLMAETDFVTKMEVAVVL